MTSEILCHTDTNEKLLANFGLQPVSNRFQRVGGTSNKVPRYPLQLRINLKTGLIYLFPPFPVQELKPHYDWLTCFEPEDHLDELVKVISNLPGVDHKSVFGAYSFKDDTTLRRLERLGYTNTWRIDPVQDLHITDKCANVETYQAAFTAIRSAEICDRYGAADVLIVRHVVEHSYDLQEFINSCRRLIRPGGYIVWELPDCERALDVGDCTTIWEEHLFYFTSYTFQKLLSSEGFSTVYYNSFSYPLENSLVAIVCENMVGTDSATRDESALSAEIARATKFVKMLELRKLTIRTKLEALRDKYGPVAIFGAGHLSVAFLSIMQVSDLVSCVIDDNPNKKGMLMPVGNLPIVSSDVLHSKDIRVCLLGLNPQNQPKVIANNQHFIDAGGLFASIFPGSQYDLEQLA